MVGNSKTSAKPRWRKKRRGSPGKAGSLLKFVHHKRGWLQVMSPAEVTMLSWWGLTWHSPGSYHGCQCHGVTHPLGHCQHGVWAFKAIGTAPFSQFLLEVAGSSLSWAVLALDLSTVVQIELFFFFFPATRLGCFTDSDLWKALFFEDMVLINCFWSTWIKRIFTYTVLTN